jgi:hypothetical protein
MQGTNRQNSAAASALATSSRGRADSARAFLINSGWAADRITDPIEVQGLHVLTVAPTDEPRLSVVLGRDEAAAARPASLAYSSESELVVHWSDSRISLGRPTYWESRPGDSPGIAGDANDLWTLEDIFALVGPDKLLSGEAKQVSQNGKSHESLAIQLGNTLASLRQSVTEIGIGDDLGLSLDRTLLRFFHQLLYIRIQEDRGEGSGKSLSAICRESDDSELAAALGGVLEEYRATLNSDLFKPSRLPLERVDARQLRTLLRSLIVPWHDLNLDFSLSRADLAGRLYQQYLKKTPVIERAGEGRQPRLLPVAIQRDEQEQTAAFYTPTSLASLLATDTLGVHLEAFLPDRVRQVRVVDPACGSGSFLVAAFRLIRIALESGGGTLRPAERERILRESLFGADIDAKAIEITQLQLLEVAELSRARLPDLEQNLLVGDSLYPPDGAPDEVPSDAIQWRQILDRTGGFDAVLMNPPFGAQLRLPRRLKGSERAALRERFPKIRAWGADLAFCFVSLALELKNEEGCAGMIVPRKLLDGMGAGPVREFVRETDSPSRIIDFRGLALFPGAAPYVALLEFLPRHPQLEALDVADSTVDPALALNAMLEDQNGVIRRVKVPHLESGDRWTPFALRWHEQQKEIGRECERLGSVQGIALHQGTQTGAQDAFTISEARWKRIEDGRLEIDGYQVDSRYAPLVAWGSDILPLIAPSRFERLFLPFEDDKSVTTDPDALATLSHLGGFKGRPQPGALAALRSPKVILRGFSREPAAFADPNADWITVKGAKGGLVIVPESKTPSLVQGMAALLCSSLYQWLLRGFGQPRHDETIEILQMNAEELPWPSLTSEEWACLGKPAEEAEIAMDESPALARTCAYRSARADVDALVFELLEVGARLRTTVDNEMVRYL